MCAHDQTVEPRQWKTHATSILARDFSSNCSNSKLESFCDFPVIPGLKNRVRQRLFNLVNEIDRYSHRHNASFNSLALDKETHLSCSTKIRKPNFNGLKSSKEDVICHCPVGLGLDDEVGREFQHWPRPNLPCGTRPMLTRPNRPSFFTRSRPNQSVDQGRPQMDLGLFSLFNKRMDSYTAKQKQIGDEVSFIYGSANIENSEEKAIEIYPHLLERTILIIDSLKTRIEQIESNKTCETCRNLQNARPIPGSDVFITKSDFMSGMDVKNHIRANMGKNNGSEKNLSEDKPRPTNDISVMRNGHDLHKPDEIINFKKDCESLQLEIDYLKTSLKSYEENDKSDMTNKLLSELKGMYFRMLAIQKADHNKLVNELKDKLQSRDKEFLQLKNSLHNLQLQNEYLKQFCKKKLKEKQDCKNNRNETLEGESLSCNKEKQYQNLLKESQDYAFAQIYEYKKAVRHLKTNIRKLKSTVK